METNQSCNPHLNVENISKILSNNNHNFNVEFLIKRREENRIKLIKEYQSYYSKCLQKIEIADKLQKTDLLFTVDKYVYNCPLYNSHDCIKYISEKLIENYFDTYQINDNTIFITWLYIEANRMNYNKNINHKKDQQNK